LIKPRLSCLHDVFVCQSVSQFVIHLFNQTVLYSLRSYRDRFFHPPRVFLYGEANADLSGFLYETLQSTYVSLQERFYFGDTVLPLFESGIPLARKKLRSLPDADNITIAYPDEGSWKRFHYQFGDYPEVGGVAPLLQRHAHISFCILQSRVCSQL